jgi:hypothetical protein
MQEQAASALERGFAKHIGEEFAPNSRMVFRRTYRLEKLAMDAVFKIDTLETQKLLCRFESIEELMNIHIAGGMRVVGDDVLMGIFDLSDVSFEPRIESLLSDMREELQTYEGASNF